MSDDVFHYQGLDHWGPLSVERMERVIELLSLERGARVIDLGCGRGELLVRLAEVYGAEGLGVDRSTAALALLRDRAERRLDGAGSVATLESSVADLAPRPEYDLVVSLGGPVSGDAATRLATLAGWVRPGGQVLWGDSFWANEPPAPYLEATGLSLGDLPTHFENQEAGDAIGLRLLYSAVSNRDEWDHFEGRILTNVERYAIAHPDDPDPQGRLEARRAFHRAQQRWGREAMGFGLYLFASR